MKKELCRIETYLSCNPAFYCMTGIFIMPVWHDMDFVERGRKYWDTTINIPAE